MGANTKLFWARPTNQPRPPGGTEGRSRGPLEVHVDDYVLLSGVYRQVRSMTGLTGGGRLLHFADREPYVMRAAMQVYRRR
ncbi:hypothetical protein LXH09_05450 [Streptomyces sp. CS7]|nr:hypothetical protein [Streptomyces sp. CS-7]